MYSFIFFVNTLFWIGVMLATRQGEVILVYYANTHSHTHAYLHVFGQ